MKLCIAIVGPTGSGKSQLALSVAKITKGELVCMDSATVYKGFDIGSAKPSIEEREAVPHHLLDLLEPDANFSAYHFTQKADKAIKDIHDRGRTPILVGGTYFYLRALQKGMYPATVIPDEVLTEIEAEFFEEEALNTSRMHTVLKALDPKAAEKIHPNDRYRLLRALAILRTSSQKPSELQPVPISDEQNQRLWLKYSTALPRHLLNTRITERAAKMIQAGLVEETKKLREAFPTSRALGSVGYAEACKFLDKKITEKQLRNEIVEKTRQLAKRQLCWIRSDPEIRFVDDTDLNRIKLEFDNLMFNLGDAQ